MLITLVFYSILAYLIWLLLLFIALGFIYILHHVSLIYFDQKVVICQKTVKQIFAYVNTFIPFNWCVFEKYSNLKSLFISKLF